MATVAGGDGLVFLLVAENAVFGLVLGGAGGKELLRLAVTGAAVLVPRRLGVLYYGGHVRLVALGAVCLRHCLGVRLVAVETFRNLAVLIVTV